MAHQIESIAYANQVPWHGLGANIADSATPAEFLKAAKLDWKVELKPLLADLGNGETCPVKGRYALVRDRDNRVMTVTGKSWKPVQNEDTLDFMRRYCEAGGAKMETAGSLRDGNLVWALAKLAHSFSVRPGDQVEGYLLITSSHIVGVATTVRTTTVRVVCANTMAMAESGGGLNYKQNHLTEFDVAAAREAVGNAHEELAACERRCKTLDQFKISMEDAVSKVLVPVFAPEIAQDPDLIKKIMAAEVKHDWIGGLMESIELAPGAIPDTGWGVLNGITHWVDHVQGRNSETRMHRAWMGDHSRNKLKAEELLMQLAS